MGYQRLQRYENFASLISFLKKNSVNWIKKGSPDILSETLDTQRMLKSAKSDKSGTIRDSELYFFGGNRCQKMESRSKEK